MSETQAVEAEGIERRPNGRPQTGKGRLGQQRLKNLMAEGIQSPTAIAKMVGVSPQAVHQAMSRYIKDIDALKDYKDNRADILADKQGMLLSSITPAEVKKMQPRDRVVAYGILYDKERLERGQSTQNVASLHSIADRAIKAVSTANPPASDDATANQDG